MKKRLTFWSVLAAMAAFGATTVDNVELSQDAETGLVTVTYDLAGDPAVVTLDILAGGESIGQENIVKTEGDVNIIVSAGAGKRLSWRPTGEWDGSSAALTARLTAWPTNDPPDYIVANLANGNDKVVRYYTCAEQVPGGVTHMSYKTEKLLLRRIHAKGVTWTIGAGGNVGRQSAREKIFPVTLTNDFYIAVYPFTQGQYWIVWGGRPGSNTYGGALNEWQWPMHPMSYIGYGKLRGLAAEGDYVWPQDGHAVKSGSVIAILRSRTTLGGLDLPLDAQWEFAARGGDFTHDLYNGHNLTDADGDSYLDEIAWYIGNSAVDGAVTTHPVGLKRPNAYGLYDMLGNISEACLDWYEQGDAYPGANYDPNVGPPSSSLNCRNRRGGEAVHWGAGTCRVTYRDANVSEDTTGRYDVGFRPAMTIYP